jgi:hypothetical protein
MPGRGTEPGPALYRECGKREGYLRHRREKTRTCRACREWQRLSMARYRVRQIVEGPRMVPTTGLKRRVRALARRGWRQADLAERLGMSWQAFAKVVQQEATHRELAERVAGLYRELWDKEGPSPIARRMAEQAGWPGPADWDDPDDPAEIPACVIERAHDEALEMARCRRKNEARRLTRASRARPALRLLEGGRQSGATHLHPEKAAMAT